MIRFTIRKSVANEIMKSLGKNDLEKLKAEVISILKNKENAELKKAAEFFEKDEKRYTHLEKSLSGEWLEKAGYGVGTVRIWKGKKYKKVSSSPVRWVRVFDKHDRGAATSMGRYIAQVERCQTVEELYNFCMKQRSLFQDENGVDLPIMDKLRSAIDKQSEKIESGKSEKNTAAGLGDSGDKDFGKKKDPEGKFNQGDKARDKRIGGVALWDGKVKSAIKSGDADKIKETISAIEKEYDSIKDGLKGDEKDFAETELKFRKRDADNALKEQEKKDSKLLSNGKTVKEVREQYGIKVDKKDVSKMSRKEEKTYTYETMGKKFTLKESEIKEELERATDLLNSQRNMLERAERYGETKLAKRIKTELKEFQYTADLWQDRLDKIKDGDYDETESEKHQNRSDAMKGKNVSDMSDDELNSAISERKKRIGELEKENIELYNRNFGFGSDGAKGKDYENWLANGSEMKKLQKEAAEYSIERGKRRATKEDSGTKVNGYGEATNREITSGTYERDQKRKQKEVDRFLGVKKGLLDLIDMLDESEDEEPDFEDNDASQPDLFNNPEANVADIIS